MKVYDLAFVCRSKNAGPFQLTIDLMFRTKEEYERVLNSTNFTPGNIASLYHVKPEQVAIKPFERIFTIKTVIQRNAGSGSLADRDVYGSQQHFPLGNIEV